jgi:hypothetical protein
MPWGSWINDLPTEFVVPTAAVSIAARDGEVIGP